MPTSAKRSFLRTASTRLAYIAVVFLLLLVVGEFTARMLGHRPLVVREQSLQVKPAGRFFQDDARLGYRGRPGRFELLLQDSLSFVVTHDADGWRKTAPDNPPAQPKPEIWIFGCSFTHGYGVHDGEDYPSRMQQSLPGYYVRNFGMDGYGTLQNWMVLEDQLRAGGKPHTVILSYGAFHDQRNTANRYWHKALYGQQIADSMRYPFVRLDENDSLHIQYGQIGYHPLPLQRYLALMSLIEERWNRSEDQGLRSKYVTELLIQRMADASHRAGAHFVLAGVYRHPDTESMLKTFALERLHTVDISQDLEQPQLRILPGNGHPNAMAHERMAQALLSFLQTKIIGNPAQPEP